MNEKLAQHNFNFCEETISLKSKLELGYLDLAQRLFKIEDGEMYKPNYETFEEFLLEIKISLSTANKLKNIWLRFIHDLDIEPKMLAEAGGWSIVAEILPYAYTKKDAEKWLSLAKSNTKNDLRKHLIEAKTGIKMVNCRHLQEVVITFKKCLKCGETHRIYNE